MKKIPSQKERIRAYLDSGKILTRLNAWSELGILECPARLSELRYEGYPIKTKMVTVMNRYGEAVRVAEWSKAIQLSDKRNCFDCGKPFVPPPYKGMENTICCELCAQYA